MLAAWAPLTTRDLARELLDALAFAERLDAEEFALVGELAMVAEDCYRAWSADLDTDGAEWRQVAWSYTERRGHRSMVLHVSRWDGEVVRVRTSPEGLGRLIQRLSEAQREWAANGGAIDADAVSHARDLLDEATDVDAGHDEYGSCRAACARRTGTTSPAGTARPRAPWPGSTRTGSTSAGRPAARRRPGSASACEPGQCSTPPHRAPRRGGDLLRPGRLRHGLGGRARPIPVRAGDCLVYLAGGPPHTLRAGADGPRRAGLRRAPPRRARPTCPAPRPASSARAGWPPTWSTRGAPTPPAGSSPSRPTGERPANVVATATCEAVARRGATVRRTPPRPGRRRGLAHARA